MPEVLEAAMDQDPWERDCSDDAYHMIAEEAHRREHDDDIAGIR